MMNTLERFHRNNITRFDNQINDKGTVKYAILDTIIQRHSHRWHSLLQLRVFNTDLVQLQTHMPAASTQYRAEMTVLQISVSKIF